MLFKVGDVLEYSNGYSAIIYNIDGEYITLELSIGEKFVISRRQLILSIVKGVIKLKSFSNNVKPTLFIKKHKI